MSSFEFFFFKQKTAYEMRISDWSSDVCSSDLEEASEPIVSAQPSTRTNSSSLKGIEITVGDSIIMPSDISADATIRSMTRKGRKIRKPIWNAVLSSLVRNAGGRMDKGTSFGLAYSGVICIFANIIRSIMPVY